VLPQPYAGKTASLRKVCAVLADEIAVLEAVIADLLEDHQGYRAVRALPGIGPVLGAVIIAEIGDVTRFRNPGQLCSWAGLTPRHRESDVILSFRVGRGCDLRRSVRASSSPGLIVTGLGPGCALVAECAGELPPEALADLEGRPRGRAGGAGSSSSGR